MSTPYSFRKEPASRQQSPGPAPDPSRPQPTVSPGALFGVLLLGLLLALGPAGDSDALLDSTTILAAGLFGAIGAFAALTLAELAVARRATSLGLDPGRVVVGAWGPTAPDAAKPNTWQQARALGRFRPLATAGSGIGLLLLAAAALGAGWDPLASTLAGGAVLIGALALLDLLPGPARSGGMLVLARAWRREDRHAGEAAVARSGIRTGWVLVALGLVVIALVGFVGIWLSLVGWLTLLHSRFEQSRTALRSVTSRVSARAAMTPGAPEVTGWLTVESALAEIGNTPYPVLPLRRFDGTLQVVLPNELLAVPPDDRTLRRAQDVARPAVLLDPDEPVERLLDTVAQSGGSSPFGLVVADGLVLGVLGPAELARASALGTAGSANPWSDGR